jgi:hypothetical protein
MLSRNQIGMSVGIDIVGHRKDIRFHTSLLRTIKEDRQEFFIEVASLGELR